MKTARTTPSAPTPGPWTEQWNQHSGSWCIYDQNDAYLAEVGDNPEGDPDQAEANARLIAAAPDLLAACYAALELQCPDGDVHECGTFALINDAIDKAEGRSS